jgi:hypothetical protein
MLSFFKDQVTDILHYQRGKDCGFEGKFLIIEYIEDNYLCGLFRNRRPGNCYASLTVLLRELLSILFHSQIICPGVLLPGQSFFYHMFY